MNKPRTRNGIKSSYRKHRAVVGTRKVSTFVDGDSIDVEVHTYESFKTFLRRMGW